MRLLSLDSSALVTVLLQERGWQSVKNVITNERVDAVMAGPALTEAIVVARRRGNASTGWQIYQVLTSMGVVVEHATDNDLIRAAELSEISKANPGPAHPVTGVHGTLSLGDSMILAITERLGCDVLTRDPYWHWMFGEGLLKAGVIVPS